MSEKKKLTAEEIKQQIFSAKDIRLEEFKVSEWDTTVWLKALTYEERNKILEASGIRTTREENKPVDVDQVENFVMSLLIEGVRDSNGNQIFNKGDIEALSKKSASAIDKIATALMEISGFGEELREELRKRFRRE